MAAKKLTNQDCKRIVELINQGHQIKDLAKIYGVHRSCISRRCKAMYKSKRTPIEIKNKVIKAIKEGHTKDADYYYRKIPFEWFKSVLKFHPKKSGRGKHAKIDKQGKNLGYEWNFSERS